MTDPALCPVCLQPWDRQAVVERRKAAIAARRADLEARAAKRPPALPPRPDGHIAPEAWFHVTLDPPKGDAA